MLLRHLAIVITAVLLLACSSRHGALPPADDATGRQAAPAPPVALEPPAKLAALAAPQQPLACSSGSYLLGAYGLEQYAGQRVAADMYRAVFSPNGPASGPTALAEAAYATYCFDLTYFEGESSVTLDWADPAPERDDVFIGLGNFTANRWDWFAQPAEWPLSLPSLAPYKNGHPFLLLAVVLTGSQPAQLNGVQIGWRWLAVDVDMSPLAAPVLQCEADALRADWDSRTPVAQDYQQVAEEDDPDGTRRIVISHTVDGYTHYGAVVIPPVAEGTKLPVLVLCHGGVGGTGTTGEDWLFLMLADQSLRQRFVTVMPSFRGEQIFTAAHGTFTSEGPLSVFNRDADDALGLLDCVLRNIAEADPSLVLAAGFSRGAQVAMRMGERDNRVKGVIDFAGMSDEWTQNGQGYMFNYLKSPQPEPDPADAYGHGLWEYQQGLCDFWHARSQVLKSCIVYHAASLPKLQIHHGSADQMVPIYEAQRLVAALAAIPGADYEYFEYPGEGHFFLGAGAMGSRVEAFLRSFLE